LNYGPQINDLAGISLPFMWPSCGRRPRPRVGFIDCSSHAASRVGSHSIVTLSLIFVHFRYGPRASIASLIISARARLIAETVFARSPFMKIRRRFSGISQPRPLQPCPRSREGSRARPTLLIPPRDLTVRARHHGKFPAGIPWFGGRPFSKRYRTLANRPFA